MSNFVEKISKKTKELQEICFVDEDGWESWNPHDFIKSAFFWSSRTIQNLFLW